MKRIAITQRVIENESYPERRDALDQRWTPLFEALGYLLVPLPNCVRSVNTWLRDLRVEGLLLSSGNDLSTLPNATAVAPERDATEQAALEYCLSEQLPCLAVCRGMQLVIAHFGGQVRHCEGHVATRHAVETARPDLIAETVNSYHNFGTALDALPDPLEALAWTADGTVEALKHRTHPIWGIMWHPEREEPALESDQRLLQVIFGDVQ